MAGEVTDTGCRRMADALRVFASSAPKCSPKEGEWAPCSVDEKCRLIHHPLVSNLCPISLCFPFTGTRTDD